MERAPTVIADADKLAQATSSLLRNALSTSSTGPIEIEVAARCLAQDHEDAGAEDAAASRCDASVSVAIRDYSDPSVAKTLHVSEARQILQLHHGRLWYAVHPEIGRSFGFCLSSQRAV